MGNRYRVAMGGREERGGREGEEEGEDGGKVGRKGGGNREDGGKDGGGVRGEEQHKITYVFRRI